MSNSILTISMITREALRILSNNLTFTGNVNRQYDDQFGRKGAKIGNTLNIRKPARYVGRRGAAANIENQVETSVPLTLGTQYGVDLNFTSAELSLSLDDFSDRVLKPAVINIANMIDADGFALLSQVYNAVGTPGTALTTTNANAAFLAAGTKLDYSLAPRDDMRSMVVDPATQALAIGSNISIFNPNSTISDQYRRGQMTSAFGFDWYMDQNAPTHQNGSFTTQGAVNGASQSGASLVTNGWSAAATLHVGDVFTIAGVYSVNGQTKLTQPQLQQFTVTSAATADGSGNMTIAISPSIVPVVFTNGLGAPSNANVSAAPASTAAIAVLGASGATSQQSVAFHRDAFVFGCADLPLPGGVDFASVAKDEELGLSIRTIRQYQATTDQFICRLDLLGGWATLYPELACRIFTS